MNMCSLAHMVQYIAMSHLNLFLYLKNNSNRLLIPKISFFLHQFLKSQQLVPVVFVLLTAGFDLSGQAAGQVVAEGVEAVEDGDNAALLVWRWQWNRNLVQIFLIQFGLCASSNVWR